MRGLFVTGTDTGVGKSVLSAALLAAISEAGERVRAHKPVVTGLDDPPGEWPADHVLLGAAAGMAPEDVAPLRYGPAASPHLATELEGETIDSGGLIARAREAMRLGEEEDATLILEGVGGLLVPLADDFSVLDLAVELNLPLLVAARPGLGTINHTLLTLRTARSAGLEVRAVALTPWPAESAQAAPLERSNRETIARLGEIEVVGLPLVSSPSLPDLAEAGGGLPWRRWLQP
ncbi:MAG TPA: dethiobiotin synthase [Solirubrobacteraceae bacterium]|nr:dethiobiotin synthase [Solirubrobacteraceae bacterium]